MFTGIITHVGRIEALHPLGCGPDHGLRLQVAATPDYLDDVGLGDSIAINGACMTVTTLDRAGGAFTVDVSAESLARTAGLDRPGPVNLEKAMRPQDRLGGHIVSGHVDGVGRVLSVHEDARAQRWRFAAPAPLLKYIAKKGSICVDGVSLTVNEVDGEGFEVALIPHTVAHTRFAETRIGDAVNLEIDLMARYAERLLGQGENEQGEQA